MCVFSGVIMIIAGLKYNDTKSYRLQVKRLIFLISASYILIIFFDVFLPSLNKDNLTDSSDIGFVNFAEYNFKLTQSSKARNFVSSIPDVPPYDFSGNPMGSEPFDAGAYQYQ